MPDWSYVPLFRPLLARLGRRRARSTALGAMRALAAVPLGDRFIEAFGDLAPPGELALSVAGIAFPGPIGVGGGLDVDVIATRALARLGSGYVEAGPITRTPIGGGAIGRDADGALVYASPLENCGLDRALDRLRRMPRLPAPLGVRISPSPGAGADAAADDVRALVRALGPFAAFVTLDLRVAFDERWRAGAIDDLVRAARSETAARQPALPLFVAIAPDVDFGEAGSLAARSIAAGADGVTVSGGERVVPHGVADIGRAGAPDGIAPRRTGRPTRDRSLDLVRALRRTLGPHVPIVGSGGIATPQDALDFVDAGATLVQLHTGLADAGPGSIARANAALLDRLRPGGAAVQPVSLRYRWTWIALLGAGLGVVSSLAGAVALTSVILPYDRSYLGMSRDAIAALDDRLLPFMVHDRVTLAGTLLALGMLYGALGAFALRRGERWAWRVTSLSAIVGFASYWLWIRYGFADPLHAIATAASAALYLGGSFAAMPVRPPGTLDRNDRAWRRSLAARLLFVTCGVGFMIGGATIAFVGISSIFVETDLIYLHTTPAALAAANRHLAPLIAHDRAGFGGVLFADGLAFALTAMWGFRRGARWLWWTILASAVPGFGATLAVHVGIGYVTFWHLAPVYFALALYLGGLALSREYLFSAE